MVWKIESEAAEAFQMTFAAGSTVLVVYFIVLNDETEVSLCISVEQERRLTVIHFLIYTGLTRRSRTVSEESYSRAATHQEVRQFSTQINILHMYILTFLCFCFQFLSARNGLAKALYTRTLASILKR